MSPRETLCHGNTAASADAAQWLLQNYAVTKNGFLPSEPPLQRLPSPYYAPWESLMDSLSTSLAAQTLRQQVGLLPVLSTDHLATEPEWRRACVVLAFLAHAYIWGGETAAEVLPPCLTLPLLAVSDHLGMPPVATYACVSLWNFGTVPGATPDPTNPDALRALHTFTGTPDESWFYMVSVAMEARGGVLIPLMLDALHAADGYLGARTNTSSSSTRATADSNTNSCIEPGPLEQATASLTALAAHIAHLGTLLERMDEHCRPSVFYHRIRPFLAGSKNMAAAGLPRGVFYDEGCCGDGRDGDGRNGVLMNEKGQGREERRGRWRQLRGGSNGQSALVQFLDCVLGVEHGVLAGGDAVSAGEGDGAAAGGGEGGRGKRDGMSFHEEVRAYMPEPHRRFLEDVAARYPGGMRGVVERIGAGRGGLGVEEKQLREAFQGATAALAEFRKKHLQMVTRYIIIPSRQPVQGAALNLATASAGSKASPAAQEYGTAPAAADLTGTGGTALLPFLKQSRDETLRAGQLHAF